jgi:hypothetical protein
MKPTPTLIAVLAAAAVFAPTAVARSEEPMPAKARITRAEDLRWLEARPAQDLRSPDASSQADSPLPIATPPAWPLNPQPIHPAPVSGHGGGSSDDTALVLGVLAGVLAAAGVAAFAMRARHRRHVPA